MSATGEITTIVGREGWAVTFGTALARWGRRRSVRAAMAAERRALRVERLIAERMIVDDDLLSYRTQLELTAALARLYRG